MRLENRVAIVTGAAQGIGKAIAAALGAFKQTALKFHRMGQTGVFSSADALRLLSIRSSNRARSARLFFFASPPKFVGSLSNGEHPAGGHPVLVGFTFGFSLWRMAVRIVHFARDPMPRSRYVLDVARIDQVHDDPPRLEQFG